MLMFSTLGPDTLKELRAALPPSDAEHLHRFIDMHDLGDALVGAGFSGIGAGILLARWMVEDARDGRYRVGRD